MSAVEHIRGRTFHGRRGGVRNAFAYGIDYVLVDAEAAQAAPRLFSRNRANLMSLRDADHGGAPGRGRGPAWVRETLEQAGLGTGWGRIRLLAQPRVAGHAFNPVSFWLVDGAEGDMRVVIAEVTNTFGDRHSYLCHRDDLGAISARDGLRARKVFHVSPFQDIAGEYHFRFDIRPERIGIRIDFRDGDSGLVATLDGPRRLLTDGAILGALLRRPLGSRRVLALIHWQAVRLWAKGARYRSRPAPPESEISRGPGVCHSEQKPAAER